MKKATYKKCPRCELNYIKSTDDYCLVCLQELKLAAESSDSSMDEDLELCPVCGQNFISPDQKMCEDCAKQRGIDLEYDDNDDEIEDDQQDVSSEEDWDGGMESGEDVELIPLSAMEEDEDDVVTLLSANGEEIDFVDIAGIAYKGSFYAILQPVELLEGMDDDEALVFKVTRGKDGEDKFEIELDDSVIDAVFAEYNKLYEDAHNGDK